MKQLVSLDAFHVFLKDGFRLYEECVYAIDQDLCQSVDLDYQESYLLLSVAVFKTLGDKSTLKVDQHHQRPSLVYDYPLSVTKSVSYPIL